jgi:hypothetical protein
MARAGAEGRADHSSALNEAINPMHAARAVTESSAVMTRLLHSGLTLALSLIADWPAEPVDDGIARFEAATSSIIGRVCLGEDGDRIAEVAGELLDVLFEVASYSL